METASGYPLWVGLVEEGSHLGMRAMNLGLSHSCSMALEEARQNHLEEHSWDWRLAVAGMGEVDQVEEALDLGDLGMKPWERDDREGESDEVEGEVVVLFQIPDTLSFAGPA